MTVPFKGARETLLVLLGTTVIVLLGIETAVALPEAYVAAFEIVDLAISFLFMTDWIVFFVLAADKGRYVRRSWIYLLASIPFIHIFRPLQIFRVVSVLKTVKVIQGSKGVLPVIRYLTKTKKRSAIAMYLLLTLIISVYCGIGLYQFEFGINERVRSASDILWMIFTTLTFSNDIVPITNEGRVLSAVLGITGMVLFSLFVAELSSMFVEFVQREKDDDDDKKPVKKKTRQAA